MKSAYILLLTLCLTGMAHGEIVTKEVTYSAGKQQFKGYLAYDNAITAQRPGVLVVHEWWGHNEYARTRARKLAGLGYTAFALDMYGNGKTAAHPKQAAGFSKAVWADLPGARARFQAAYDLLAKDDTVNGKIAAIGYCFGGAIVLEMARSGMDLKGVASFHGSLSNPNPPTQKAITAKILVANGADDPFVKPEHIAAFKAEMADAKADLQFISYPGAKHAFTNPEATALGEKFGLPLAYNADADERSWNALKSFLTEIFTP